MINEKEIMTRAAGCLGKDFQAYMVVEELAELQQAILKLVNRKKGNIEKVVEEIADVEIMLHQLKICFEIEQKDIDVVKEQKLSRLVVRLDEMEKK